MNCCLHVCSSFLPFEFAILIGAEDPGVEFAKAKIPPIVEQDFVLDYLPSRYETKENPGFGKCIGFVLHSFLLLFLFLVFLHVQKSYQGAGRRSICRGMEGWTKFVLRPVETCLFTACEPDNPGRRQKVHCPRVHKESG